MVKNIFHISLLLSFVMTVFVPLTGITIHKLASTLFLLLSFIHLITYSKKLTFKHYLLMIMIIICFVSGILGMIFDNFPIVLIMHKVLSISLVFFLAIHIFVYHKKMIRI